MGIDQGLESSASQTSTAGWTTYVTGLLFVAMRKRKDKVALRADILKYYKLIPGHVNKADVLPAALYSRCEKAVAFKLQI